MAQDKTFAVFLGLLLIGICGCGKDASQTVVPTSQQSQSTAPKNLPMVELTSNPKIILDDSVPVTRLTVKGIKLGENIHQRYTDEQIKTRGGGFPDEKTPYGLVNYGEVGKEGLNVYFDADGQIFKIRYWHPTLFTSIACTTETDVDMKFGKPDSVKQNFGLMEHTYLSRKLIVGYRDGIEAVTIQQ